MDPRNRQLCPCLCLGLEFVDLGTEVPDLSFIVLDLAIEVLNLGTEFPGLTKRLSFIKVIPMLDCPNKGFPKKALNFGKTWGRRDVVEAVFVVVTRYLNCIVVSEIDHSFGKVLEARKHCGIVPHGRLGRLVNSHLVGGLVNSHLGDCECLAKGSWSDWFVG